MSPEQAVEQLVEMHRPEGIDQLFYYALLNQRLETYGAWTLARDTFQELETVEALHPPQRQLLVLLKAYNQNRINWYLRNRELRTQQEELALQLQRTKEEKAALESKIKALTDLEAVISTRKEE